MDSHESNEDDDFSFDEIDESANEENILMAEIEQNSVGTNYSRNGAFATASFSSSSSDSDLNSSGDVEEEEDIEQVWPSTNDRTNLPRIII